MSELLIAIIKWKVKEDKVEQLKRFFEKLMTFVEANEPQIIAFNGFMNEEGTEMTVIQVHPNTASMETHMQVMKDNWDLFGEYSEVLDVTGSIPEYYGTPPADAVEMDRQLGVEPILKPLHIAGFTRSSVG